MKSARITFWTLGLSGVGSSVPTEREGERDREREERERERERERE